MQNNLVGSPVDRASVHELLTRSTELTSQVKPPSNACVIDDESDFADFLAHYLTERGVPATTFPSAESFLQSGDIERFDFFIVDLGLPGLDGVDLISMIRARNEAPVLVISGRIGPDAFISAITAGADMVLNKPVRFDQVFHAIQSIARRLASGKPAAAARGDWVLNARDSTLVAPNGEATALTPVELRVMQQLVKAGMSPVSRNDLTSGAGIVGETAQRNLDAVIFRLRRKVEQNTKNPLPVRTTHGVGYQLTHVISVLDGSE